MCEFLGVLPLSILLELLLVMTVQLLKRMLQLPKMDV